MLQIGFGITTNGSLNNSDIQNDKKISDENILKYKTP
jgi:hypothetical protein